MYLIKLFGMVEIIDLVRLIKWWITLSHFCLASHRVRRCRPCGNNAKNLKEIIDVIAVLDVTDAFANLAPPIAT